MDPEYHTALPKPQPMEVSHILKRKTKFTKLTPSLLTFGNPAIHFNLTKVHASRRYKN